MNNATVVMEPSGESFGAFYVVDRVLFDEHSEFQRVQVFESNTLGTVLMLDSIFNVSTRMESYYHEPMAHVPVALAEECKRVLIIGGGDFGIAKEVLKHTSVESVVMCELDPKVIEACRLHFPEWAACEQDARFTLIVGDGCAYIREAAEGAFDAIIIDSTDPILHAPMLISEEFYRDTHRALASGGVCMQIIADHILYPEAWETILPRVANVFADAKPLFLPIPFYATGAWGLMIAGKQTLDTTRCNQTYLDGIADLRTMTEPGVQGWFTPNPEQQQMLEKILKDA